MKIELYLVPGDKKGILLKKFLERNKLPYKEIVTNDINILRKVSQNKFLQEKISLLKIAYKSCVEVITGFNPLALKQLLEHIEKYKSKIE